MSNFTLTSNDIFEGQLKDKQFAFNGFGHDGDNISPQLAWENAPEGTKSFAVTCLIEMLLQVVVSGTGKLSISLRKLPS